MRLDQEDIEAWRVWEVANRRAALQYAALPIAAGRAKAVNICACGAQTLHEVCRKCRAAS